MRAFTNNELDEVMSNGSIGYYQSMKPWWVTTVEGDTLTVFPWWSNNKKDILDCFIDLVIVVKIIK